MAYNEYQSEDIDQLLLALNAAKKKFSPAIKNKSAAVGKNGSGRRYYADLQSVIDASSKPMDEQGFEFTCQIFGDDKGWPVLYARLHHLPSGQWIASEYHAMTDIMGGSQGQGSAITYGRRYIYVTMLGIVPEDDDGEAAQRGYLARKSAQAHARQEQYQEQQQAPAPAPAQPQTVSFSDRAKAAQDALAKQREEAERNNPEPPSENLRKAFIATLRDQGLGLTNGDREQTLGELSREIGRTILSTKAITATEMYAYLDRHSKRNEPAPGYGTF